VLFHAVVGHRDAGGIEGVGLDDVGTGIEILRMDAGDDPRLREREQVVVAGLLAMVVLEAITVVVMLFQAVALDHGAHGTVKYQDAPGELVSEKAGSVGRQER
jgi:hypothetical protein